MKEEKKDFFFAGHMQDLADRAFQRGIPVFSDFLTGHELSLVRKNITIRGINIVLWGGHKDCDHVIAGFFPVNYEDNFDVDNNNILKTLFPISVVQICQTGKYQQGKSLGHRDYLGAILGLGMERSKIGDIRICENAAYVFCQSDFAQYMVDHLTLVGRFSVKCNILSEDDLNIPSQEYEEKTYSVASVRLDNVVSAATGLSRTKAAELVRQGRVVINHIEKDSVSYLCPSDSIFSIRGYGKFRLVILQDTFTKKGKQKIILYKYL